jgi:hypothetical protein
MQALIGSRGVIGQSILHSMCAELTFNSDNINTLKDYDIDRLIIAAPSGNRLYVNQNKQEDADGIDTIVNAVAQAQPKQVILIGSLDAAVRPDTPYGHNRLMLEQLLREISTTTVLRLSTLIGSMIKKNMLYDIKHNQYVEHIDPNAMLQWCLLDDLPGIINNTPAGQTVNVASVPIKTQDIISCFCPNLYLSKKCNTSAYYDQGPYMYSRDQIFAAIEKYLKS